MYIQPLLFHYLCISSPSSPWPSWPRWIVKWDASIGDISETRIRGFVRSIGGAHLWWKIVALFRDFPCVTCIAKGSTTRLGCISARYSLHHRVVLWRPLPTLVIPAAHPSSPPFSSIVTCLCEAEEYRVEALQHTPLVACVSRRPCPTSDHAPVVKLTRSIQLPCCLVLLAVYPFQASLPRAMRHLRARRCDTVTQP